MLRVIRALFLVLIVTVTVTVGMLKRSLNRIHQQIVVRPAENQHENNQVGYDSEDSDSEWIDTETESDEEEEAEGERTPYVGWKEYDGEAITAWLHDVVGETKCEKMAAINALFRHDLNFDLATAYLRAQSV